MRSRSPLHVALVAFVAVIAATAAAVTIAPASDTAPRSMHRASPQLPTFGESDALVYASAYREQQIADFTRWVRDEEAKRAAAAEAQRQAAKRRQQAASGGQITGDCASMKPAGFPDSIIWRESRGNAAVVNSSSGARGCAQIMPEWFNGACRGMSYADCWALIWNGGRGASNWACTRESGCAP